MKPNHRRLFAEISKYALGCGCSLLLKIMVTAAFTLFAAPTWIGYLVAQVVVLFTSYSYHTYITFRQKTAGVKAHLKNFSVFTGSVLLFKVIDYTLVVLGTAVITNYLRRHDLLDSWIRQAVIAGMIVGISGIIFVFRYFLYRFIFRNNQAEKEPIS